MGLRLWKEAVRLKHSVRSIALRPELMLGLVVSDSVYRQHGTECVVTSLNDSHHAQTSLHYAGCAADIRTRNLPPNVKQTVRDEIKERLTVDYDVVLEGVGTPNEHIHIEYQPRRS